MARRALHTLATKLARVGLSVLLLALASITLTLWLTRNLEGGAAAVNEAGRMRMQIWRLAAVELGQPAPDELRTLVERFDASLRLLAEGDPERPLAMPADEAVAGEFARVRALWDAQKSGWLPAAGQPASADVRARAEAFVAAIDRLVSAIEQQIARWTALLNLFQFAMMLLAVGAAVVMMLTGYLYVLAPLAQLQQALARIEAAKFDARVDLASSDEFGQVAQGFNRMAASLQASYGELEARVAAKTRRIEAQRARLQALYDISAFLGRANALQPLAQGFAERVCAVGRADALALRLLDESRSRYVLAVGVGLPESMCAAEHSLAPGQCACGAPPQCADAGGAARARVLPIRTLGDAAAPRLPHCERAGFAHLVRVPVCLQGRVIGEIDLLYRQTVTLDADELELLDALASHLATAVEGLRAEALEREAAVSEERALLARELHDSIAQALAFLKIQSQLLRGALEQRRTAQVDAALDALDAGLRESIGDVRELLLHFRTRTCGDDIEQALQETLQKFQHQTGLDARLELQGAGLPLPADVQIQVLHVLQEALSNVRKHAGAQQVRVEVERGPRWRFTVADDGRGFEPQQLRSSTQVGLAIMRERAARIGARLDLDSAPGRGTRVRLELPAQALPDAMPVPLEPAAAAASARPQHEPARSAAEPALPAAYA
jgi:two-component system nitrate/nitrite sensor histidine kinase NarX